MTTGRDRIRAALDRPAPPASAWRPNPAMEALAALPADQVTPTQRMALGHYKAGKAAAGEQPAEQVPPWQQ